MIPQLRDYQIEHVNRLRAARANGARIVIAQAATGAGKTSIACFIAKQAVSKGSSVLFLVHRRRLVEQIYERLEEFEVNAGIIMRGEKQFSASVQVASRDTILSRCFRNEWIGLPPADLVIVDEGHRAQPESEYRRILEQYPRATILLLTATPVGPDGAGMGPWAQAIECAAPTSQLVRDGYLVPVKCFAPDRKMHRGKPRKGIAGDLVDSWKEFSEGMPTVLFCSRVSHSLDAVDAFNQAGIMFAHVDADTPDDKRDEIFAALESGKLQGISNVAIAVEGIDIPCVGCVQLYCNVEGRVKFVQATGRAMRPFDGMIGDVPWKKERAVLIDHSGAVFNFGFPDEDTDWSLTGNADAAFKEKRLKGLADAVNFCKACELLYKTASCPQCGRMPQKPPKSIFAADPVDVSGEILTEAERGGDRAVADRDAKIKHWLRCLGVAANRNGTFAMASVIFKQKYGEYPPSDYPCAPERGNNKAKVADVYPRFKRQKAAS